MNGTPVRELLDTFKWRANQSPNTYTVNYEKAAVVDRQDLLELTMRVEAVLKLHVEQWGLSPEERTPEDSPYCHTCGRLTSWPCPTYRALNGEQP